MEQVEDRIFIERSFTGVTLGALALSFGTILIDAPACPNDARSWRAALRNLGSGVSRLLINLDEHYDRTLGARAMECPVIGHIKTAQIIRNRPLVFKGQDEESGADWEHCIGLSGIRCVIPDLTFGQHALLHWDNMPVILEHHPGSAPGAIWVILPESKVVFVGDTVVLDQPPFLANANLTSWVASLGLLSSAKYRDYLIISGRGGLAPVEAIRSQLRMTKYILNRMESLASREEQPEATESMIPKVLSGLDFPRDKEQQYTRRLQYGLNQYYLRHYCPSELPEEGSG